MKMYWGVEVQIHAF